MNEQSLRKPNNTALGSIIIIISYLSVAMMAAAVKLVPHTVHIGTIIFFQYFIAFILCLPGTFQGGIANLKTQQFKKHLIRDFAGILTFGFFFLSVSSIPLVKAIVLRSTTPFWIPLLLFVWRRDHISKELWLSILIGFIGVLLIVKPGSSGYLNLGTFYALLSGLIMGISALTIRRLSATEPVQRTLFYYFLIATITSLPFALLNWVSLSLSTWLLLISIGILMYIVQYTLIAAFRYAKASVLAPMSYSAIIFSGILDWLIWDKTPDVYEYFGIALIVCAGIATILIERSKERAIASTKSS